MYTINLYSLLSTYDMINIIYRSNKYISIPLS